MKKLLVSSLFAASLAAFSVGYPSGPAVAQINIASGIAQDTADSIVSLMSRWNTALSDANAESLTEIYVPEDRDFVQEIVRGRGKAVGTGVDVRAIERTGPDSYRVRFVRFWGGARPGRASVSIEVVQVGEKLLLKVPESQKVALSQRSTPAAVTPVPESAKPKVAEIAAKTPAETTAPATTPAPAPAAAAAPAVSAQPAPPAAPKSSSAAAPVIVEPTAPKSPVAPLVVTTDTKPRVAAAAAPAPAQATQAKPAAEVAAAPAPAAAAPAVKEAPAAAPAKAEAAANTSKTRLGPGVDQPTADGLIELVNAWNVAIADVNTEQLIALHVPEDKEAVEKMASTRGKSVDSKVSITSIEKTADNQFRVRIVRSWGGPRGGKATNVLDAVQRDGKYLLRVGAIRTAAVKKPAEPKVAAATAAATEAAPSPAPAAKAVVAAEPASKPAAVAAEAKTSAAGAVVAPVVAAAAAEPTVKPAVAATKQPELKAAEPATQKVAAAPVKKSAPARAQQSSATKAEGTASSEPQESVLNIDGSARYVFAKVGHATLIKLPISANRVAVGDPNILDFTMINPRELYVLGKSVGTTNMILWEASGRSIVIPAAVNVDLEPLSASIRNSLPDEQDMKISSIAGSIVLTGSVSNGLASKAALDLANAFVANLNRQIEAAGKQQAAGSTTATQSVSSLRVIDLLRLRDSQQVMLEVRIAEISKTLLEQLGVGIRRDGTANSGSVNYTIFSRFPFTTTPGGGLSFVNSSGLSVNIQAEKRDSLLKILAEPTIVSMSGQEGSFLAGGTVYVPAGFSTGGVPGQPVEKEYGVSLKFLPTVLDGGRISLRVAPEVSELASTSPVAGYPAFTTRKVSTTVQLRSGQSLLIGGLLKNKLDQAVSAFPILGELPIIGALFRSSDYNSDKTELVVIVSPSVIKASEAAIATPTDNFKAPSRTEFFIEGSMEKK